MNLIKALGGGWEARRRQGDHREIVRSRRGAEVDRAAADLRPSDQAGAAASARRSRRPSSGTKRPRSSEYARTETRKPPAGSAAPDAIEVIRRVAIDVLADRRGRRHADREVPAARAVEIRRRGKMRVAVQRELRPAPREHVAQRRAVPQRLAPAHRVPTRRMVQQHDAEESVAPGLAPAFGRAARAAVRPGGRWRGTAPRAAPSTGRSTPRAAERAASETHLVAFRVIRAASSPRM